MLDPQAGTNHMANTPQHRVFAGTALGIDYGQKRLGLAIAQSITMTSTPLKTLHNTSTSAAQAECLHDVIQQWQPDVIIIGYPLHADGTETKLCHTVKHFAADLQSLFDISVFYENEYLSSIEAEGIIRDQRNAGIKRNTRAKGDIDQLAAALILQRWLDQQTL